MRIALISIVLTGMLSACTGPQRHGSHQTAKPAEPATGVTISGQARYGVVWGG